ncbi:MAG: hypothetical protein IKJ35_02955 [Clostridia bacterium]|nr:hypothetical protein [Clostridia bacterium]
MFSFWKSRDGADKKESSVRPFLIVIAALVGIALLLFGDRIPFGKETVQESCENSDEDELMRYQDYLEERVKLLCESVAGVKNVTAVVTLSGGFEKIYATEIVEGGEEYVIIGSGSSAEALFLSRAAPTIEGIGIVCQGGGNPAIKQELTALLSATFHLSSNRIYITESQK